MVTTAGKDTVKQDGYYSWKGQRYIRWLPQLERTQLNKMVTTAGKDTVKQDGYHSWKGQRYIRWSPQLERTQLNKIVTIERGKQE